MDEPAPTPKPSPPAAPRARSLGYLLTELLIVTAGVLIALSVDSLRGWNKDRQLIEQARRNIGLGLEENRKDVERVLAGSATREKELENVRDFVNEMLRTGKSSVKELALNTEVSDLSAAAWHSAERTGALSLLNYDEVQRYSRLYAVQELYVSHQQQSLRRITSALALISDGDPHDAAPEDLRAFRQEVRALTSEAYVGNMIAKRLIELYTEMQPK